MHHIKPVIHKPNDKVKPGRGFSPDELSKAGVNKLQARQMGLPVDYRRRTSHDENVENLKAHAEKAKADAEAKAAAKPAVAEKKAKSK
jgi:large subunit ribosomal protein L13e